MTNEPVAYDPSAGPLDTDVSGVLADAPVSSSLVDIEQSRALAVDRIFRGGVLAAGGIGVAIVTGLFPAPGWTALIGGVSSWLMCGAGAISIGRGAKHLADFGRPGTSHPLVAIGGLGVSAVLFGVAVFLYFSGALTAAAPLLVLGQVGVALFLVATLLLVLRAVLIVIAGPKNDE